MNYKIEKAKNLIKRGYTLNYRTAIVAPPNTHSTALILKSHDGKEEYIEFDGMESSLADTFYYDYLLKGNIDEHEY